MPHEKQGQSYKKYFCNFYCSEKEYSFCVCMRASVFISSHFLSCLPILLSFSLLDSITFCLPDSCMNFNLFFLKIQLVRIAKHLNLILTLTLKLTVIIVLFFLFHLCLSILKLKRLWQLFMHIKNVYFHSFSHMVLQVSTYFKILTFVK